MKTIDREQLEQRLSDENLAIIEVLESDAYRRFHIPGAMNVPLAENFESEITKAVPDKEQDVVVYCWDENCNASPKAAQKMEALGYEHVFDYEAGKKDWHRAGMPIESSNGNGRD